MSLLNEDQSVAGDEVCERCRYAFGPLFLACGCAQSEFFESPVHPLGCCPWFKEADESQ
jgi:hypothetical protein